MYAVRLTEARFPAQADSEILESTIGGVLRSQVALTPDAPALVEAPAAGGLGRRWTYAQLLADAERLAQALLTRYVPGERICVWAPNLPEWVLLEFASGLAGLTLVTANPAYQPRELRYVLEQSGAVGLFMVQAFRGNPMGRIAAEVAADLPALREIVDLADAETLFAGTGRGPSDLPEVQAGDAAQIQYTSGTTGFPKGAVLTHRGLTNNARLTFARGDIARGATVLNFMPMFHTAGCAVMTLGAVQSGCRTILAGLFEPGNMNALIEAERVDVILGVPTMLVALLESLAAHPRDTSSISMVISGGSMVPPEVIRQVQQVYGCAFQTVYGQTETSPVLTQTQADDTPADVLETVGQPLPQTEIAILEPGGNRVRPVGAVGEICARGYGLMLGYNDNPAATAAAIDPEGWLRTGDLGTMDARGYVRVTGRVKEMIIRGGENLFPAEIENVLLEHPDVAEVAVVGIPDPRWGEVVACFLRLAAGAALDREDLVRHCRSQLSAPKTPALWIAVDAWPLTGSGKIQKFVLRDRYMAGEWSAG